MLLKGRSVTVYLGAADGHSPRYLEAARTLGRLLAERGASLVYGGASVGTMGALANGALAAGGSVTGVIPRTLVERELAHATLTESLVVDTMHVRKTHMIERADAFVALPGGYGTWEEVLEVLTWKQIGLHQKPVVLMNLAGFYDPLLAMIERAVAEGFVRPQLQEYVLVARDPGEVIATLEAYEPPATTVDRWS